MNRPRAAGGTLRIAALAVAIGLGLACGVRGAAGPDLAADAQAIVEAGRRKFGPSYTFRIDDARHLVYISAFDPAALQRAETVLAGHMDAQRRLLFPEAFPWNVTVILPTASDYRGLMADAEPLGFYQPATHRLVSISLSDVLVHEFTHALHHADQARAGQVHAAWVIEGLATLMQRSRLEGGAVEPLVEPSLARLQADVRDSKALALRDLCRMAPAAVRADAKRAYVEARYVMLYLYRIGKLKSFYESYKAGWASDPTGVRALEATAAKPLDAFEADWRKWVLDQPPPWTPARPAQAHLGVRMEASENGVEIKGLVRGSAAERAGRLKAGDVILSVAGRATPAPADVTEAVQACRPGETVEIEVLRDGRTTTVLQLLGVQPP